MTRQALGLIETIGFATAVTAVDAATKAAQVEFLGYERVIGVSKSISVTAKLAGEVAAVQAAVDAGKEAGSRVGQVVASHVIPRPHEELDKVINTMETKETIIKKKDAREAKKNDESAEVEPKQKVKKKKDK